MKVRVEMLPGEGWTYVTHGAIQEGDALLWDTPKALEWREASMDALDGLLIGNDIVRTMGAKADLLAVARRALRDDPEGEHGASERFLAVP